MEMNKRCRFTQKIRSESRAQSAGVSVTPPERCNETDIVDFRPKAFGNDWKKRHARGSIPGIRKVAWAWDMYGISRPTDQWIRKNKEK